MRRRLIVLVVGTTAIIGGSYIGWNRPSSDPVTSAGSRSDGYAAKVDRQQLVRLIGAYETRVQAHPNSADFAFLGQLYLQRGRQSGDLQTYQQAEHAINEALALDPTDA